MQQSQSGFLGWKWRLAFLIVIFVEVYYMFQYSSTYGVLSLAALILLSIVVGMILMRWEGAICWARINYLQLHNMPTTDEMRDGVLILFAGILMIIPGLITDVIGLFLFLPPVRWIVRKLFLQNLYFDIPEGMDSQFRMYSFTTSKRSNDYQNDSYSNEDSSPEDYSESDQKPFNQNPDVQIIDVKATVPQKSPKELENDNGVNTEDHTEEQEPNAESQEKND